ncbi:Asp-tRNA(Asn)/Glu-tRNA(Gln) amidotransferase subunit GatC [soil metagenome]|nr:Asp-tRNA(Asn)/Glu-tRNA(Gln) amidotransferase subunit GatC [Trueperaceae bacterium]
MPLTDADLDHLADLARLELPAEDRAGLRRDLDRLLGYVALLQEVDVDGVVPMQRPMHLADVLRDDEAVRPVGSGDLEALAPATSEGRVVVPRTVDGSG